MFLCVLSVDRAGDSLDPQVLAESGDAVFDAVTADPVAAERGVGRQVERVVDVDRAGPQALGHGPGPILVTGLHVGRQTVTRVVGNPDGLVVVTLVPHDGQHRAEYLVLGDLGVLVDVGDHGRLVPEALAVDVAALAAAQSAGAGVACAIDKAFHPFQLVGSNNRAPQIGRIRPVTPWQGSDAAVR